MVDVSDGWVRDRVALEMAVRLKVMRPGDEIDVGGTAEIPCMVPEGIYIFVEYADGNEIHPIRAASLQIHRSHIKGWRPKR